MEDDHPLLLAICQYYASFFDRILADDDEEEDDDEESEEEKEEEEDDDEEEVGRLFRKSEGRFPVHASRPTNVVGAAELTHTH